MMLMFLFGCITNAWALENTSIQTTIVNNTFTFESKVTPDNISFQITQESDCHFRRLLLGGEFSTTGACLKKQIVSPTDTYVIGPLKKVHLGFFKSKSNLVQAINYDVTTRVRTDLDVEYNEGWYQIDQQLLSKSLYTILINPDNANYESFSIKVNIKQGMKNMRLKNTVQQLSYSQEIILSLTETVHALCENSNKPLQSQKYGEQICRDFDSWKVRLKRSKDILSFKTKIQKQNLEHIDNDFLLQLPVQKMEKLHKRLKEDALLEEKERRLAAEKMRQEVEKQRVEMFRRRQEYENSCPRLKEKSDIEMERRIQRCLRMGSPRGCLKDSGPALKAYEESGCLGEDIRERANRLYPGR